MFCFAKDSIAVIDFDANNARKSDARVLTERLTTELIKVNQYIVVERSKVDKMLKEQKFQHSGCVDVSCAVEVGNVLGARYIVVGTMSKFGQTYTLDARLVDVQSSESIRSADYTSQGRIDDLLLKGVPSIVRQLVGKYDDSEKSIDINEEPDNSIDWSLNNFLSYFRVSFDISPEYSQDLLTNPNVLEYSSTDYPKSGLSLSYEYAMPNGLGIGVEYQFARNLNDTEFGYNSFYFLYNFTIPKTGLSLSIKSGINDLLIYEDGEAVNDNIEYDQDFGDYASIVLRYPISDLMHLEIGSTINSITEKGSLSNATYELDHSYSKAHIGLTFILK